MLNDYKSKRDSTFGGCIEGENRKFFNSSRKSCASALDYRALFTYV